MGTASSLPQSPLSHFSFLNDERFHLTIIRHQKTGQLLIYQQLAPNSPQYVQQIELMMKSKLIHRCPFVTELVYWSQIKKYNSCGTVPHYLALFNNAGITLKQYISAHHLPFNTLVLQASHILESTLKGLRYFSNLNHLHDNITQQSLLYDGKRTILLDPWLTSSYQAKSPYKSPQKQLFQQDQITFYNKFSSLLYQIGLLFLDLLTGYSYSREVTNSLSLKIKVGPMLEIIPDFKLRSKLNILLNPNPEKRLLIYSIILPDKVTLREFNTTRKHAQNITSTNPQSQQSRLEFTSLSRRYRNKSFEKETCAASPFGQTSKMKFFSSPATPTSVKFGRKVKMPRTVENCHNKLVQSSFTYAQMLRTPTQTNSNYFESKKSSPFSLNKKRETSWHIPHKIVQQNFKKTLTDKLKIQSQLKHDQLRRKTVLFEKQFRPNSSFAIWPYSETVRVESKRKQKVGHQRGLTFSNLDFLIEKKNEIASPRDQKSTRQGRSLNQELRLLKSKTKTIESIEKEEEQSSLSKLSYLNLQESIKPKPILQPGINLDQNPLMIEGGQECIDPYKKYVQTIFHPNFGLNHTKLNKSIKQKREATEQFPQGCLRFRYMKQVDFSNHNNKGPTSFINTNPP